MKRTKSSIHYLLSIASLLLMSKSGMAQFYQGYQMDFGKNRIQYEAPDWTFYRFKNFDTYFYLGGKELAVSLGQTADKEIEQLEKLFDFRTEGRLQFLVYNKLSDYKQSNVGLGSDDLNGNTGGLTRIVGNKVLLYFDGNYDHFKITMREGIAQVLMDQLMYGGNVKDRLQSSLLLTLPEWYTQGLISFAAENWNTDLDNRMRDMIVSGKFKKFNTALEIDPELASHSMWQYIAQTYGETSISNILYLTRLNRNVESGFSYVLNESLKSLSKNWLLHYQKIYNDSDTNRTWPEGDEIKIKAKDGLVVNQVKASPDNRYSAFVTNQYGKYRVCLYDQSSKKKKRIWKGGYKDLSSITDHSYPVLAWHPSGQYLTMFRELKGKIYMEYYFPSTGKKEINKFFYFEKVLDASYSSDGQDIILSAIQKGQSDLFVYNVRTRTHQQLTNDVFNDLNPRYIYDSQFIIFSSNRPSDTLGLNYYNPYSSAQINHDIFLYDISQRSNVLLRITKTENENESHPLSSSANAFVFLSDQNGIKNRIAGTLDSVIAYIDTLEHYRYIIDLKPQTDFARGIESYDINASFTQKIELYKRGGKYRLVRSANDPLLSLNSLPSKTHYANLLALEARKIATTRTDVVRIPAQKPNNDSLKIDINNYIFQSEFNQTKANEFGTSKVATLLTSSESLTIDSFTLQLPKQRNYDISFSSEYFLAQLDNNLLNFTYQKFTGGAPYFDPGLNGLFKLGISDLFDDYKIKGGFRLSGNLNSNEYLLSVLNQRKRLDKEYSFFRQAREFFTFSSIVKVQTHEARTTFTYPFSNLKALKGSIGFRSDRTAFLSTDIPNLREETQYDYWANIKIEYVFDNTLPRGLNLFNGTRYKAFFELFNQLNQDKNNIAVVGFDVRHYQKIHKQIIFASRLAGSTSFGKQKLIYYLGSTNNTLVPTDNFDFSIPIDFSQNYAFQAVATNVRGFLYNIRNGNSFAVANNEIRIPIFEYLINTPIRSDFIRNFQAVGFADIGTAWTGNSPYDEDNAFNSIVINQAPLFINIKRKVDPIVAGYGFGLRSRLLGYFMRIDWAWGIEDERVLDPVFYWSLGLDF
ncbi:MAG TPA: hypothetical protein PKH65_07000 [Bacteroidia bacterium]|nr:hypothetical protein [Bacteroidia bacterium]HNT80414.1 hypothetical protein [Bacteroidia bacterium]